MRLLKFLKTLVLAALISNVSAQSGFYLQKDCSTHFGANLQGRSPTEEVDGIKNVLKMKWMRVEIDLSNYNSGVLGAIQTAFQNGIHVSANCNYGGAGGSKVFPTASQLPAYRTKLHTFLLSNAQFLVGSLVVIENEPLNTHFYDWTPTGTSVHDYLAMLQIAVDSFRHYDIQITDGCTHLAYYGQLCNGNLGNITTRRADSVWNAARTMKLNFINYHFEAASINAAPPNNLTAIQPGLIKTDGICAHDHTGHLFVTNEWHQENNGTAVQQDSMCVSIVTESRKAHVRYAINFSGDGGSQALPLVDPNTGVITHLGIAFRDAALSLK